MCLRDSPLHPMHIFDRVTCLAPDCGSPSDRKSPYCPDHVPVFYRDQNDLTERPCMIATLDEAREMKRGSEGKFENRGRTFRLHQSTPEPVLLDDVYVLIDLGPVEGRNSCRKVGEYPDISYRVKHFSYPVPAWGARNRPMHVIDINRIPKVPIELLAAAGTSAQVQA